MLLPAFGKCAKTTKQNLICMQEERLEIQYWHFFFTFDTIWNSKSSFRWLLIQSRDSKSSSYWPLIHSHNSKSSFHQLLTQPRKSKSSSHWLLMLSRNSVVVLFAIDTSEKLSSKFWRAASGKKSFPQKKPILTTYHRRDFEKTFGKSQTYQSKL